jgi:hypothetical protein
LEGETMARKIVREEIIEIECAGADAPKVLAHLGQYLFQNLQLPALPELNLPATPQISQQQQALLPKPQRNGVVRHG